MRVGILVVDEYDGSGTTTWLRHLLSGAVAPGDTVELVRRRSFKSDLGADPALDHRLRTTDEIVSCLDDMDRVILQSIPYDKKNKNSDTAGEVWWRRVLDEVTVPWSVGSHADSRLTFDVSKSSEIMRHPKFSGLVIAHSVHSPERFPVPVTQLRLPLPYRMRDTTPEALEPGVLMLGRVVREKSWPLLVRTAVLYDQGGYAPARWTLAGRAVSAPGPCSTYRLMRTLVDEHGATVLANEHVREQQPARWAVRLPHGSVLSYWGGFDDASRGQLLDKHTVLMNPTPRRGGSFGPTEYVTLEALEAGLMAVHGWQSGAYDTHLATALVPDCDRSVQFPKTMRGDHDDLVEGFLGPVRRALELSDERRREIAERNRAAIHEHHDPSRVLGRILDAIR